MQTLGGSGDGSSNGVTATHVRGLDCVPGSGLHLGPAPVACGIQEVNQWMEARSLSLSNKQILSHFNYSLPLSWLLLLTERTTTQLILEYFLPGQTGHILISPKYFIF